MTNRITHRYHKDESIFIYRGIRNILEFLFFFSDRIPNRIVQDGTPRFAASHLGLDCLPIK